MTSDDKKREQEEGDDEKPPNPMQDIRDTYNLMLSGRMVHCMPVIIWSAWSLNFFAGVFIILMTRTMKNSEINCEDDPTVKDCWDDDKRNLTALFTMTLLGAGEMIGGGFVGGFRDKFGTKAAFIL